MKIAECSAPLVYCLMILTSPISWPIGKLLDCILGEHKLTRYSGKQLQAIIKLNTESALSELKTHGHGVEQPDIGAEENELGLPAFQAALVCQILMSKVKIANDVIKENDGVFKLSWDDKLDGALLNRIHERAFSRIPIYYKEPNFIVGILLLKSLVKYSL